MILRDASGLPVAVTDCGEQVEILVNFRDEARSILFTPAQARLFAQAILVEARELELGVQAYRREWAAKGIAR